MDGAFQLRPVAGVARGRRRAATAEVLAVEEALEGDRGASQAFDHVFRPREPTLVDPPPEIGARCRKALGVVAHGEALHRRPLGREELVVPQADLGPLRAIPGGDRPAEDDAGADRDVRQRVVQQRAPHVVEHHVEAASGRVAQEAEDLLVAVVQTVVEASDVGDPGPLLGRTGRPDDEIGAHDPRDLAREGARGAGRGGDERPASRFGTAEVVHPDVRRQPGDAEDVEGQLGVDVG